MYKSRITQWGLDKKYKEDEMRAIVHKNKQRADLGKESVFSIRGRAVEHRELERYFKRKHLTIDDVLSQRQKRTTPEPVQCRTPSPRTIASPDVFAIPERIFRNIHDYYWGSFENETWLISGQDHRCYSSKARGNERHDLQRLYEQIPAACEMFEHGNAQEAGQILISATANLKIILLAEHPLLLRFMFAIVLELDISSRCELEIGLSILKYLSSLGEVVLGREHPVVRISGWLALVHTLQLHSVAAKALEGVADHFSSILGPMHCSTLHVRLAFIASADTYHDLDKKVHQLRDTLEEYSRMFGFNDRRILDTRWTLAILLIAMKDYQEAERVSRDMMRHARQAEPISQGQRPQNDWIHSESLHIMACSRWGQQDKASSVRYIMDAIDRGSLSSGTHDGRARIWMMQLEGWLVEMGHLVSAATIRERRQESMTSWRSE
jgi:hypothetical protein